MNPYFVSIINDINNGKSTINLSDSNLTDENVIEIADLIKANDTVETLIIGHHIQQKNKYMVDPIDITKFKYHLNMTIDEIDEQYNNNIKNKITIYGYNYLLNALKYNNSIHTLIIYDLYNKYNASSIIYMFINKLSEVLSINESIVNLTFMYFNKLSDVSFIKLCEAIKNHKTFECLDLSIYDFNDNLYDIFINSLKNHKYIYSLNLNNSFYRNTKLIEIINNLKYIQNLYIDIQNNYNSMLISELIFKSLENKKYLTKLDISTHETINFSYLTSLLNVNKHIKYLGIYGFYDPIFNIDDNNFTQSIINSKLQTLKINRCEFQINSIINIILNNNTINKLDISENIINGDIDKLFDKLKFNENITTLSNLFQETFIPIYLRPINSLKNVRNPKKYSSK